MVLQPRSIVVKAVLVVVVCVGGRMYLLNGKEDPGQRELAARGMLLLNSSTF